MPIRILGKVSLSDEIKMLEMLRDKLLSVRGQARLIAASTGDEATKERALDVAEHAGGDKAILVYLIARAREAQYEADQEASRAEVRTWDDIKEVTLQEDLGRG